MVVVNVVFMFLVCCLLMYGIGMWVGIFVFSFLGGMVVINFNMYFDFYEVWKLVEWENVIEMMIVGDVFVWFLLWVFELVKVEGKFYDIFFV